MTYSRRVVTHHLSTMARPDPVKERLLREVVRENLDTIQGLPPRPLRRTRRYRDSAAHVLRVVLVPAVLFLSMNALYTSEGVRPAVPVAVATAAVEVSGPAAAPAPVLVAPRPIDPAAFALGVRKIILDPGHGGSDPGAPTSIGLWEKSITLDVARRLRALLEEASFEVAMTRERDETVSLRERAQFANARQGDLFISIHVNSLASRSHRGVETYYLGATDDPHIERLAGVENRGSGYSLADFRRLLEGVYVHARQTESRRLAEVVHRGFFSIVERANPALRDDGVKKAPFLVLVATDMPGMLAEVACLSNDEEAKLLADPNYRQHIARGLFTGIRVYADARNTRAGGLGSL